MLVRDLARRGISRMMAVSGRGAFRVPQVDVRAATEDAVSENLQAGD